MDRRTGKEEFEMSIVALYVDLDDYFTAPFFMFQYTIIDGV